jgi:hypothetical protein
VPSLSDVICSAAVKVYEKIGVDKDCIRGMGIVLSSLESDTPNDSSPSKMSSWLKSGPTKSENEVKLDVLDSFDEADDTDVLSGQIAAAASLPTYSQLDQDVLNELPDDVLKEVQSMYRRNNVQSPPRTVVRASVKRSEKPITIPGQVSVKRMLKLASVKAGEDALVCDNDDFTLSQLDCLPLETQLQIANRDHVTISKSAAQLKPAIRRSRVVNSVDVESESDSEQNNNTATQMINAVHLSRDFFSENIRPLKEFIESTPHPDDDDIDLVAEFLKVCVDEDRLEDAIVFLRTIKTLQQCWDASCYQHLKENFLSKVHDSNGYLLDSAWHDL